jgi:pantoate--beta-alanine ligase
LRAPICRTVTLYDAHNHLQDQRLKPHLPAIMSAVRAEPIARMVVNGSCEEDWPDVLALARQFPQVLPSFGYHPWYVKERTPQWAQFGPHEDLAAYPRNFSRDKKLCAQAGVDVLFAPSDREMYPAGFSTYVAEERLSQGMEGAARPTHFRGVTTVLAKLFHIVQPSVAVFGAKDFQQAAVVQKMVQDLNFPLKIVVSPIVREPGGLALSSRNKYLTPSQHRQAAILRRALERAREAVVGASVPAASLREELRALIASQPESRLDYIEFFDPQTLAPVHQAKRGTQIALAVFIGKTRLIDNAPL